MERGEVFELLRSSGEFRRFFTDAVLACGYRGFFWETPPVTRATLNRPFEFAAVESKSLALLDADGSPFAGWFAKADGRAVLTFPNLGGDALLVVPVPLAGEECYPHLARFLGQAPPDQVDAFWQAVGEAMEVRLGDKPVWLSTAGMGVSWLHLRLDPRPKYYRHDEYKVFLE